MKKQDVLVIAVVALSLTALVYYFFFYDKPNESELIVEDLAPKALSSSAEQSIEESFRLEIPENIDKTELINKTEEEGVAIATREVVQNEFVLTVLANVPDGEYYAALVRDNPDDENFDIKPIGQLKLAKGGYLSEFESTEDFSDYDRIVVSKTPITISIPDELVFDGSF